MAGLSHVDDRGDGRMVDVSGKDATLRTASASVIVRMKAETLALVMERKVPKGDAIGVARVAGIMAAKQVPSLIPMCHPLPISAVKVDFEPVGKDAVRITGEVKVFDRTGVEMEALTAVSVAALALYDMVKAVDRAVVIDDLHLVSKSGGKSGDFKRI